MAGLLRTRFTGFNIDITTYFKIQYDAPFEWAIGRLKLIKVITVTTKNAINYQMPKILLLTCKDNVVLSHI